MTTDTTQQHTPGPWEATGSVHPTEVFGPYGSRVCRCDHGADVPSRAYANARRIVTAVNSHDDLLAACEAALDDLDGRLPRPAELLTQLRAAIRKAKP